MEESNKKIKLFIITQKVDKNDSNLGFFHQWLKEFSNHTKSLKVVALSVGEYDLPENVEVFALGKNEGHSKLKQFFVLQKLLFNNLKNTDGIFVHMCPEYVIASALLAKLFRKKIILWYTHKSVTNRLRLAERLVDRVLTASKESFRLPSKKLVIMGHGINTDRFKYKSNHIDVNNVKLLAVGRICPTKDLETSIKALKILREDGMRATLNIVGEPYLDEDRHYLVAIQEMIKKMELVGCVRFLGKVHNNNMPEVYYGHNILLHSSSTGSMDKVVLEALVCGSHVASSSEAFTNLGNDFIWEANNCQSLARCIKSIINNRPDISDLSKKIIDNNSLSNLIERICSFYYAG